MTLVFLAAVDLRAAGDLDPGWTGVSDSEDHRPWKEDLGEAGADFLRKDAIAGGKHSEALGRAWDLFNRAAVNDAVEAFSDIVRAPDVERNDEIQALYGLGVSKAYKRPNSDATGAQRAFLTLVEKFPDSLVAPWALLEVGILLFKSTYRIDYWNVNLDNTAARSYFQRVIEDYPDSLALHEAVFRLADSYIDEVDDNGVTYGESLLADHLRDYPNNPLATAMYSYLGRWLILKQDYQRGVFYMGKAVDIGFADPMRQSQYNWVVAILYERGLNQPEMALKWYQKLVDETPHSRHAYRAKKKMQKLQETLDDKALATESES